MYLGKIENYATLDRSSLNSKIRLSGNDTLYARFSDGYACKHGQSRLVDTASGTTTMHDDDGDRSLNEPKKSRRMVDEEVGPALATLLWAGLFT
jgi:hypothetical protein